MSYNTVLQALADPTRREVFERLRCSPQSVGELAAALPISQPAVSQHLKVLRTARLVDLRQDGTRHIYRISREGLLELRSYLESFWDDALAAFEASGDPHPINPKRRRKRHER
jgi:DNA-binding transcriptional ArsR family regulator